MAKGGPKSSKKNIEHVPPQDKRGKQRHDLLGQQFAALSTLVQEVAHDMDNVLLAVRLHLSVLRAHARADGATTEHLMTVQAMINQLCEMVHDLTRISRDPTGEGSQSRQPAGFTTGASDCAGQSAIAPKAAGTNGTCLA